MTSLLYNAYIQNRHLDRTEYPESYDEPTSSELARAHTATSKRLESQYEGPLKTKAIREKEERQRKAKWPSVGLYDVVIKLLTINLD